MLQDQPQSVFVQGLYDKGSDCPIVGIDMEGSEEEETTEAKAGVRVRWSMRAEAWLGTSFPPLILAYLGQLDTRGSIKRLAKSPTRFTSVSWKMVEGLGVRGLPSSTEYPSVLFTTFVPTPESARASYSDESS